MKKRIMRDSPLAEAVEPSGTVPIAVLELPDAKSPEADLPASGLLPASDAVSALPSSHATRDKKNGRTTGMRQVRSAALVQTGKRFAALPLDDASLNHQAELFYLQKQIQLQTRMVFVLEDGSRVQGVIEWYDRHCIKVRGKSRVLIFKSAIKYLHKAGDTGALHEE